MPFKNAKQEMAMKINVPKIWREWVQKYGHAPGFKEFERSVARKHRKTSTVKRSKKRRRG